jgi:sialic acid synthase SpsE
MIKAVPFGDRMIGQGYPVIIIAEIGVNHEGNIEVCKNMIKTAAHCGVDAVKLQTVDPDKNYLPGTESHSLYQGSALSKDETKSMFDYARSFGMEVFTTCGDFSTLEWVDKLQPSAHKISSGLLTHAPLISRIAELDKTILMSTGMATEKEIDYAVNLIQSKGNSKLSLFHCTSVYPAPNVDLNLAYIQIIRDKYGVPAGFSDHSIGVDAAFLAVASGATVIEKHFSLDPSRSSYDHNISVDSDDLSKLVRMVNRAQEMMGCNKKILSQKEKINRSKFHRYLVASRDLEKGDIIASDDLSVMRVHYGDKGLLPKDFEQIIGKHATKKISKFDLIAKEDFL